MSETFSVVVIVYASMGIIELMYKFLKFMSHNDKKFRKPPANFILPKPIKIPEIRK